MKTDKNNTKKNNSYNVVAVTAISEKRGLSKQYIRQCLKGDRKSISADQILKEYRELVREIEKLVSK
jgi:hypothetical protein